MNKDMIDSILQRLSALERFVNMTETHKVNLNKMNPGQKAKTRSGSTIRFLSFDYGAVTFPFIFRVAPYDLPNGERSEYLGYDQFGFTFFGGEGMDIVEILPEDGF